MRIPVPTNRLVAFTLVGALLTTLVATGLALPQLGLNQVGDDLDDDHSEAQQVAADAPAPNENFTPAVQTQASYGEEYEDEHDEDDEDEHDEDDEDDEDEHDEDDEDEHEEE
jgi:hypothetical protein